jgi:hypothetical protein
MADICPDCWREHGGKCDTRTVERRILAQNVRAATKAAAKIAKDKKGK